MKTKRKKTANEIARTVVVNARRNFIIGLMTLMAGVFALPANAQCEAKNDAFQSGEHVMYDLYFNWKFVWVKAGIASLTTNATTYQSEPPTGSTCSLWAANGLTSFSRCAIR